MYISVICAVFFTVHFTSVNAGLLDILRTLSPKLSSGDYKIPISLQNSSFAAVSVNSSNANTVSYGGFSGWFEWKNIGWWNIDQFFGASNRDTTQSASSMGVSYGRPIGNGLSNVFQSATKGNRSSNSFSKESNAANPWLSPSRFLGKCGLAINKIRSERARNSQRTLPIFNLPQIFSKQKYPTSNSFTGTPLPILSKYKHTWPPAVQKKFGSAVCDALDSQLQDMYRQFQAVRNVATPQHWTLISSTGNSSEARIESDVIRVWKLNYAGIDALLSSQPQIRSKPEVSKSMWNKIYVGTVSDAATTNANLRKTTDPHDDDDGGTRKINGDGQAVMGVNTSVFKMISRRWPCIKAQCSIPEVTPVQLQKVLWESDSASVLLRPDQSSTFAAVSLEHRYDLVRFDHQTKLVWSRFKFPWSSIVSSSSSGSAATTVDSSSTLKGQTKISVPGETKRIDVSGELLSLSHHFYDTATQTYVLLSQSVAPPLAKALLSLHNTAEAASEVDPNAAVLQQAMQQQSQRSHVRLSVTLLSAKGSSGGNYSSQHSIGRNVENLPNVNFGDECRGTEMMQVSQTQWQTLPSLLVWQSVGPATISYLRNVQRFAPKLIGKRFVASNVQNERRDGK